MPTHNRKKLLILSRHPETASFRQRVAMFFDALGDVGIEYEILQIPRKSSQCIKVFAKARDFDCVFLHKKRLNRIEKFFLKRFAKKIIYDFDDAVMYDNSNPEKHNKKKFTKFVNTIKAVDTVIAGNQYLADIALKFNPNVKILPTGLDLSQYIVAKKGTETDHVKLVWIGSGSNLEYLKQISPALEQIGKKYKNVSLKIICNEFFDLENMAVEKIEWSQQSQGQELADCDIGLGPLPDDNFTRGKCGFKLLQYAAASLPIIASPVGVNAEIIKDGTNGFHAINCGEWIEKLSIMVKDKKQRIQMGKASLTIAEKYNISALSKKFTNIILETLSE